MFDKPTEKRFLNISFGKWAHYKAPQNYRTEKKNTAVSIAGDRRVVSKY